MSTEPVVTTTSMSNEPVVTTTSMPVGPVVFLHRQDTSVKFTRPWVDYKNAFGSPDTNYWMGLDRLHTLTSSRAYGLRVDMTDWDGKTLWAKYDRFRVGPEYGNYTLSVGGYDRNSTATDGMMFTTYDRDNDGWSEGNCARDWRGGWWYSVTLSTPQVYTCQVVYVMPKVLCGGIHLTIVRNTPSNV